MRTRESFAEATKLSTRILGDLEKGRRDSYSQGTLLVVENALEWEPGSIQSILDGGDPTPVAHLAGYDEMGEPLFFLPDRAEVEAWKESQPLAHPPRRSTVEETIEKALKEFGGQDSTNPRVLRGLRQLLTDAELESLPERVAGLPRNLKVRVNDFVNELEIEYDEQLREALPESARRAIDDAIHGSAGQSGYPAESQSDYELARREGETEERRRRRLEGEPWDQADPEGPDGGA